MVRIHAIDIERSDGPFLCGTLEFGTLRSTGTLLWSVGQDRASELVVEFFPGSAFDDLDQVREAPEQLIGPLLDTLCDRLGRETLFT
jgi:hypothetical protein